MTFEVSVINQVIDNYLDELKHKHKQLKNAYTKLNKEVKQLEHNFEMIDSVIASSIRCKELYKDTLRLIEIETILTQVKFLVNRGDQSGNEAK